MRATLRPLRLALLLSLGFVFSSGCVVSGNITADTVWAGYVIVADDVYVNPGVTLTILPGTVVAFRHCRDYTHQVCRKVGLTVGGKLIAEGTPNQPVVFTSDASDPLNGDWHMLRFENSRGSRIRYAVVEFAQQGVNLWHSDTLISDSTVRWNNWEGIYLESYSTPIIERNHIYQNGYNGVAMEQFNNALLRENLIESSGTHGVHVDASKARLEYNVIQDNGASGLSVDDAGEVTAVGNKLTQNDWAIQCGEGNNRISHGGNATQSNRAGITNCPSTALVSVSGAGQPVQSLTLSAPDYGDYELGYTPGDPALDRYMYIYPDSDGTRRVVRKIGDGLGLTWSLAWDGEAIWTATVGGQIYRLDPVGGGILRQFSAPGPQPWGMTYGDGLLWVCDFAEKVIYALDPQSGAVAKSFPSPDPAGGLKGLAWGNGGLYGLGWTSPILYFMDSSGHLVSQSSAPPNVGGGLTYDGTYFWAPCDGICRFDGAGNRVRRINAASEGTWDLTWDGHYLWASQRTNENWLDAKIYQIEVVGYP